MMQFTQWFDGSVKPVHIGVYERYLDWNGYFVYSFWDGKKWGINGPTIDFALRSKGRASAWQDQKWRGLANKPKK